MTIKNNEDARKTVVLALQALEKAVLNLQNLVDDGTLTPDVLRSLSGAAEVKDIKSIHVKSMLETMEILKAKSISPLVSYQLMIPSGIFYNQQEDSFSLEPKEDLEDHSMSVEREQVKSKLINSINKIYDEILYLRQSAKNKVLTYDSVRDLCNDPEFKAQKDIVLWIHKDHGCENVDKNTLLISTGLVLDEKKGTFVQHDTDSVDEEVVEEEEEEEEESCNCDYCGEAICDGECNECDGCGYSMDCCECNYCESCGDREDYCECDPDEENDEDDEECDEDCDCDEDDEDCDEDCDCEEDEE